MPVPPSEVEEVLEEHAPDAHSDREDQKKLIPAQPLYCPIFTMSILLLEIFMVLELSLEIPKTPLQVVVLIEAGEHYTLLCPQDSGTFQKHIRGGDRDTVKASITQKYLF